MSKTPKLILGVMFVVITLLVLSVPTAPVEAQTLLEKIKFNLQGVNNVALLPEGDLTNPWAVLGDVIKAALLFVGTIFLVLTLYAGFLWMTAAGNADQVKKAAGTMRNSVIGLLIIFLSYALTVFVFNILFETAR